MGATVEKVIQTNYTDASGNFYEGMKREDAEGRISLFYNKKKIFDRIDKDGNGELSKYEITSELENDIKANKDSVKWMSGLGIINGILGMTTNKKVSKKSAIFTLGLTLGCLGIAIRDKLRANNLEKRITQGFN